MTINVLADGADGYRLVGRNGETVGWVRGRAIGVTGFDSERDTVLAAVVAFRALAAAAPRLGLPPLPEIGIGPARLVHDGADRWVACDLMPIARLLTVPDQRLASASRRYAFELLLRGSRISDGAAIAAALLVLRTFHPVTDSARITCPTAGARDMEAAASTKVRLEEP